MSSTFQAMDCPYLTVEYRERKHGASTITSILSGKICKLPNNNIFQTIFQFKGSQEMQIYAINIEKGQILGSIIQENHPGNTTEVGTGKLGD